MSLPKAVGGRLEREASERLGYFWVKEVSTSKSKQRTEGGKTVIFFLKKKLEGKTGKQIDAVFISLFQKSQIELLGFARVPSIIKKFVEKN